MLQTWIEPVSDFKSRDPGDLERWNVTYALVLRTGRYTAQRRITCAPAG